MSIWDAPIWLADRAYNWATFASFVGAAFTAASVIVLFWATGVQSRDSDRRINEAKVTAAQANERAAELEKQAADAREKTALTEQEVAATNLQDSQFYIPRLINVEQEKAIIDIAVFFPGTFFDMGVSGGTGEAYDFARRISSILKSVGWIQRSFQGGMGYDDNGTIYGDVLSDPGIDIAVGKDEIDNYKLIATLLSNTMYLSGFMNRIDLGSSNPFPFGSIHILIGSKPL